MKKMISMLVVAMMAMPMFGQNPAELAKQQEKLNKANRKLVETKTTKSAEKMAKELKKEGWTVPAGESSIAAQITKSELFAAEQMADETGAPTSRYIMQPGMSTGGTYNAAYAAARSAAQLELAALIKTELVAIMEQKLDNDQSGSITALTVEKFNERAKAIVDETLTNTVPFMRIYRRLPNNNIEVQVRIAFDKKELAARIKRNLRKQLEAEGDKLLESVDEVFNKKLQ